MSLMYVSAQSLSGANTGPDMLGFLLAIGNGLGSGFSVYLACLPIFLLLIILTYATFTRRRVTIWQPIAIVGLSQLVIMYLLPVLVPFDAYNKYKTILDVGLLMLLISPIAWRLKQISDHLYQAKRAVEKNLQTQNAINSLSAFQLPQMDKEDLFNHALAVFFAIDWLEIRPSGVIFLLDPATRALKIGAYAGLSLKSLRGCEDMVRNYCLDSVMADTEVSCYYCRHAGVRPGVKNSRDIYVIALISEHQVKGILCLYPQPGRHYDKAETAALKILGATLAELIRTKQFLIDLSLAETVFKHSLT
ncbi:MAG: GAF domain-containing protein, partial [Methylomonas sp.]